MYFSQVSIAQEYLADTYKASIAKSFYDLCIEQESLYREANSKLNQGEIIYNLSKKTGVHSWELTIDYQKLALGIFESIGHDSLEHMVNASMCYPLIALGQYDEAEKLISKALTYWKKTKNVIWEGTTYSKFGFLEHSKGNYFKALEYYLKNLRLKKITHELKSMGALYNIIGVLYMDIGDHESALNYFEEFLNEFDDRDKPKSWRVTVMTNAAKCYNALGQDSIGRRYFEITNKVWINSSSSKFKARAFRRKSSYSNGDGLIAQARNELDSAIYHAYKYKESKVISDTEFAYYKFLHDQGLTAESFGHLEKAYAHAKKSNYISAQQSCAENLSKFYKSTNDLSLALEYDAESDSLKSILFSEDVASQIKKLDLSIQEEKSEKEVNLLKEKNRLTEQNIKNQNKIRNILICLFLFALFSIALLYNLFRQRSKTSESLARKNKTITKTLEQNKTLMKEVHHRVKNNLQVVSSLLYLQSRYIDSNLAKDALQAGRSRVQAMSLLHQKLYQNENIQEVNIKSYFTELCESIFLNYKDLSKNITYQLSVKDIVLDIELVIPLGLIVNELISNALQHAFEDQTTGNINIELDEENEKINLTVSDNGIGLPFTNIPERSSSLGLELVKSFAEKISADLIIENVNGTIFSLRFDKNIEING